MLASDKLRIVFAASEAVPFSKTGGLADVSTALAKALDGMGHDITLVIPDYREIRRPKENRLPPITDTGLRFRIAINGQYIRAGVNWTILPDTGVKVLMITQEDYFDRPALYMENGQGYPDNCERYCFFSRAVLELCRQMVLRPDIIHCNDWQTGLVPALLHAQYARRPGFENAASVMTLHNMAYQGRFWHLDMPLTGMDWNYFNLTQMEMHGDLNLLKTGIAFADQVTTVSPTYASEICTSEGGEGLDHLLSHRRGDLTGILNGIDDEIWNPAIDPHIAAPYCVDSVQPGKGLCKAHLQQLFKLPQREDVPVFGMVSRMSDQKGFDLIAECADRLMSLDAQFVFLGTGDPHFEYVISSLAEQHPDRVGALIGFDDAMAHQIEAGADLFLMPSRFEPCGLNQMYSLQYGTLPVVRKVGGLADSVVNVTEDTLNAGTATGFVFEHYAAHVMADTIERAIGVFHDRGTWAKVQKQGMSCDWSWNTSAAHYLNTYRKAMERKHHRFEEGRE